MLPQHGRLELSREALAYNVALLRRHAGSALLCAALKANAYGHGCDLLAPLLYEMNVPWACVYSLEEALALAPTTKQKILALAPLVSANGGGVTSEIAHQLAARAQNPIRLTLADIHTAQSLASALTAAGAPKRYPIHVQIDTGLTRAGLALQDAAPLLNFVAAHPALRLEGIYAHLSHGDVKGDASLMRELDPLMMLAAPFVAKDPQVMLHLQNSGGLIHIKNASLDMVRLGISLYGLQPSMTHPIHGLRPIAKLTAPILIIHDRPAGVGVGYGHTFTTQRPSRLAILPVGYGDGYPRALSNRGVVQINNALAPVVGRVSMDQIIIDVTDIPAKLGDIATAISNDPAAPNSADHIAQMTGTIGYEITTGFGSRLERIIVA
jgi:alanine racemase